MLYKIGDAVVKKVIDYAAEQYTQDSKVVLAINEETAINGNSQTGYVVITRTYPLGSQMPSVGDLNTRGGLGEIFLKAAEEQDITKRSLSFAAILKIESLGSAYSVNLIAYSYPYLKAKNSAIPVPFTDFDDTKSVLQIGVKGPQGSIGYDGGQYSAEGATKLEWKRGSPSIDWVQPKGGSFTLFTGKVTKDKPIEFSAKLIESSDITSKLKELKEDVDVKSWVGDDDDAAAATDDGAGAGEGDAG
ncbi:MAG: hypothetical protein ACSHYF_11660 [Verrucomicrobiaceae bacterium]